MTLSDLKDKVALTFMTNDQSSKLIQSKSYMLAIHNGYELKITPLKFEGKNRITKLIKNEILFSGINIFTVFDPEKNTPILERLFFNANGISKATLTTPKANVVRDSIAVEPVSYTHLTLPTILLV